MLSQELKTFKSAHNIRSVDKWAEDSGVSKSTILRALNGTGKDMGVNTLQMLVKPYNGSIDALLGIGSYSPEAIEKEELKTEIQEKIETVIETIENIDEIPNEPTQEIKTTLEEVHEYITNEPIEQAKCVACAMYRETIAELKEDKNIKDKWLIKLFGMSFALLGIVIALIVAVGILSACLVNAL